MSIDFNPIDYTNELESAGVPTTQAKVHASALGKVLSDVASFCDIATAVRDLRKEILASEERTSLRIELVRTELHAKIDQVRTELEAKIEQLRTDLEAKIEQLRTDLEAKIELLRSELLIHRWVLGLVVALCSSNLALTVKLLMR
ncbi:MAG: hypothetical protein ACJ8GW_11950 [Massilia sp.]